MTKILALAIAAALPLASAADLPARARPGGAAPPCGSRVVAEVLEPARDADDAVRLSCSLTLHPADRVTKRLVLEGAAARGVAIDCRGATVGRPDAPPTFPAATLEIRSAVLHDRGRPGWSRPSDVTVKNCTIAGPIRIWGMGINGQGAAVKLSSRTLGHTERAQAAAPTRILIERVRLVASGPIPLYLAPGVSGVTLLNSHVAGHTVSTAVYMDAESARNTLIGNTFDVGTGREVVALDGSAHNVIRANTFRIGHQGGVYLYRNCGEGGTVRHQTPSHNTVSDNRFSYESLLHFPAVNVGARSGWGSYCREDAGYPFGSSIDDGDGATDNIVAGNVVD